MRVVILLLFVVVLGAAACQKTEQVRKVSFTIEQRGKPLANEEIAIMPLEGDKVQTSDAKRLGLGKTDSQGRATIEFRSPAQYKEYAIVWRTRNLYVMLRREDQALTFKCDSPSCDLGKVVFETFEFSGGSR